MDRGSLLPLPGQVVLAQNLPDHLLNRGRQSLAATAAAGTTRDQVRDHAVTLTPPTQQDIDLPAGDSQLLSRRLHRFRAGRSGPGQRTDHLGPMDRQSPHLIGDGQQTALKNHVIIDCVVAHKTMEQRAGRAHG